MHPTPNGASITVLGPGRMGTGIAQVFATHGHDVSVLDVKERPPGEAEQRLERLEATVRSNVELLARHDQFGGDVDAVTDRLHGTRDPADGLEGTDWLFEALPEDPQVKRDALDGLRGVVPEDTVIATTTSSISLETLADAVDDPGRLLITHWLNPAFIVPLVEVARTEATDVDAVDATVALLRRVGKEPVVCRDRPGFIGSRVQATAMNEAVRAYEEGVADAGEIDRALRSGVGFRMAVLGLIEFIDIGGVDILYYVNEYLAEELGPRFENPESVVEKMAVGHGGLTDGRGYYDYDEVDDEELREAVYEAMLVLKGALYDAESAFDEVFPSIGSGRSVEEPPGG